MIIQDKFALCSLTGGLTSLAILGKVGACAGTLMA